MLPELGNHNKFDGTCLSYVSRGMEKHKDFVVSNVL